VATILRGKRKGQEGTIHQFANDWFTIDFPDDMGVVVNPASLMLSADEVEMVRNAPREADGLFRFYDLSDEGRFTKRKRPA
jgi:hypothetical protein